MGLMKYPPTIVCDGCQKVLTLTGSPGMDMDDAIRSHGWDVDEEGNLCEKCHTLATRQASFKGLL